MAMGVVNKEQFLKSWCPHDSRKVEIQEKAPAKNKIFAANFPAFSGLPTRQLCPTSSSGWQHVFALLFPPTTNSTKGTFKLAI